MRSLLPRLICLFSGVFIFCLSVSLRGKLSAGYVLGFLVIQIALGIASVLAWEEHRE